MRQWRGWMLGGLLAALLGGTAGFGYCCLPPEGPPLRVGMTRAEVEEAWGPPVSAGLYEGHPSALYQSKPNLFGDYCTRSIGFDEQQRVAWMESDDLPRGPFQPVFWLARALKPFLDW